MKMSMRVALQPPEQIISIIVEIAKLENQLAGKKLELAQACAVYYRKSLIMGNSVIHTKTALAEAYAQAYPVLCKSSTKVMAPPNKGGDTTHYPQFKRILKICNTANDFPEYLLALEDASSFNDALKKCDTYKKRAYATKVKPEHEAEKKFDREIEGTFLRAIESGVSHAYAKESALQILNNLIW